MMLANHKMVCYTLRDNVVPALVAGRLISAATWNEIPTIVGCTIIPRQGIEHIVRMREEARVHWAREEGKQFREESPGRGNLSQEIQESPAFRVRSPVN